MRNIAAIFTIIFALSFAANAQDNDKSLNLDSMTARLSTMSDDDTAKITTLFIIAHNLYNADSVEYYSKQLIELARKKNRGYMEARGYDFLWWAAMIKSNYPEAGRYASKAILIGDSLKDNRILANGYYEMGCYYEENKDMNAALDNYYTSLKIYQELNDTLNMKFMYDIIGLICIHESLFDEAEKCLNYAKEMSMKLGDNTKNYYNIYGSLYQSKYQNLPEKDPKLLQKAKEEFYQSLQIARDDEDIYTIMQNGTALASVMLTEISDSIVKGAARETSLNKIKELLDEALNIHDTMDDNSTTKDIQICMADYYTLSGDFDKAEELLRQLNNSDTDNTSILYAWVNYYRETGNKDMVIKQQEKIIYQLINSNKVDFAIKATQNIAQDELKKQLKQREIEEAQRRTGTKVMIIAVLIILAIVLLSGIYIYTLLRKSKKLNSILNNQNSELRQQQEEILTQRSELLEKNEEIERQKAILQRRNSDITSSINYASMIQRAAMPDSETLAAMFKEFFVIYRPLNLVAGDFYWAQQTGNYKTVVAADCTGHGVPGAFVSMLGISILNDLNSTILSDPSAGHLLDKMRVRLKTALHQSENDDDNHDGIDLAMVIINEKNKIMHYAGANRPLLRYRNGEITKFAASKMPIGIHINESGNFQDNVIDIEPGDVLYMYSDGIIDQFGINEQGLRKKFSSLRLQNLLKSIAPEPLAIQQQKIENSIDSWKSNQPQIDDIIVMGIRI